MNNYKKNIARRFSVVSRNALYEPLQDIAAAHLDLGWKLQICLPLGIRQLKSLDLFL